MAPMSKHTLTSYRRTQPNREPVEKRLSKTPTALEQQKLVLAATQKGQEIKTATGGELRKYKWCALGFSKRARLGCTTEM